MTRLGIKIPNFGPGTGPESLLAWARFAEEHGFALIIMPVHAAATPDVNALYPEPFYDAFTTLGWLTGRTERVGLGASVTIVPYRHPLQTARVTQNLHRLSSGRFVLGAGVGWAAGEFAALGVPFRERGALTDEYLATVKAAWSEPHPPLWIGGAAPATLRRVVRFGDAWHPNNADPDWLRDVGLPAIRSGARVPAFCPRTRTQVSAVDGGAGRRFGTGSLAQVCDDVTALMALGAEYIVLVSNPDHPDDRRPAEDDWAVLSAIAERCTSRA